MSRDGKDLTLSVERRERKLRRAVLAAAVERPVTVGDIRPGLQPDIAAALAEYGRIRVCPRPDDVKGGDAPAPDAGWREAVLSLARSGTPEAAIADLLGVSRQAVRNLLSAARRRGFGVRRATGGRP